jgi:ABC-type glutathione transport system ATPase component
MSGAIQAQEAAVEPVIDVRGLSKTFASHRLGGRGFGIPAVRDVSFRLEPGRTLALVGESGSGKTTVARMIVGLETPTTGEIECFGRLRTSGRPSTRERREFGGQVQMVFQNPYRSLDPSQPVGGAIADVLRLHSRLDAGGRAARILELLELVRLPGSVAAALPRQLSGGQRQRICIARALAATPRVLILDEAVSSLDVSVQAQILNLLCDIRDETGVSYLFITHDLGVVRQIADEVVVMRAGEVVERGSADTVLDAPQHPYTRLLIDSVPREGWQPGAVAS